METKIIKILAIDDIQDNLIILKALINESIENTIVFTAITGKIGIEIAALENPDVILLDILMPEMDGFEVCKILKADNNLKEIPVVFVTALKGDKAIRIKALEVGAEAFLAKPIDESELIAQIKAMVKIKEANFEKLNKEKILLELVAEKTKELTESNKKSVKLLEDLLKENEARKISEQAVIESEDKYSKAFQTSPYCITITSLNDGTFVDVNESFCETTGFTKEEVIGKKVGEINVWFNLEDRKYVINSLLKNEKIEQQLAYFRKKNGEKIIAIYSAQVIHINGASHILASINDITKQKLAELNLLKLNRIQSLNSQINDLIIRIHNKMQLFEEVCEIATTYGNFRMCWISQIDEQSKVIFPLVWHGHEEGYLNEIKKISIENNLFGNGPTGIAYREGKVSICNNIATDPKMEPWRKEALKRGYLSSIALPIKVRKKVIGTFNLYSGEVDFFAQNEEVELLENITSSISFSLEKILDEEDKIEAEQKVREKDIEFRKLSANVSDLIFQFTRRPDGSYFVPIASEGIINIFGCKPEDVANDFTAIANVLHPEDTERVFNDIEYSAAHLTNFTCEFRVQIPGKSVQWIYSKSNPEKLADGSVTWYGFNTDITDRKNAEDKIRQNEAFLSETQMIANLGTYTLDITKNSWESSEILDSIFGIEKSYEKTLESWAELIHPDWQKIMLDYFVEEVIGKKKMFDKEYKIIRQNDQTEHWVHGIGKLEFDGKNIPIKMIGTIRDITERKQAEEKIHQSEAFLKEAQRIAKLGTYSFNISNGIWESSEMLDSIFGINADFEKTVESWTSIIHPDWQQVIYDYSMVEVIGNKSGFDKEYKIIRQNDQAERWIHGVGKLELDNNNIPIKMIGTIHDITERKQAEIVIKENEERHKAITLTANDGIVSSNNKGIITGWNRAAEKIFGYTDDEIIGKPLTEIIPPHFKEFHEKGIERFDKKGEKNVIGKTLELQGLHKNGTIFPLELSLAEWETSKGKFITGFIKDITERKRAELELEKSISTIRKLSVAIEQSPVTTVITDLDGGIVFTNPKFTEATGYSPEEALGKNPRLLNSGYTTKDEYKKLWETILSGNSWHGVFQNKKKNGELFWEKTVISPVKNELGEIINFLALKEDITDQKKTDEAFQKNLRELEDYKFALDETAIVSITDKDGIITYANKNFSNISKYSNDELVGQNHRIVNSGYHDKEYFKNMWSTITNGKVWVGELRNKAKDGRVYWVYGTIIPFLDKKNIPTQYLAIRFDITERKTAEEGVLLSNERYNLVAKATNDSIWDLNILTNEIIRSGGGFEALFGYKINQDNEEYLHYKNLIHPDDLERVIASKIEIFDNPNEFNWEQDYRFLKANGEYAFVHDKGYIIRDETGKAIRMIGATQDITEREQHIKSIEDQNRKLREIAWKQSHIVRAPVARIMGLINLLKYEEQVGEETVQLLKYIEMSAHELDAVIKSIVTSTSNEKG